MSSKFKIIATILGIVFFQFACTLNDLSSQLLGHYEGKIPCADCPGIVMTLELKEKAQYESQLTYLEKNNNITEKGVWMLTKKDQNGSKISVIELTAEKSEAKTYLYLKNNTTLQLLDSNGNKVPAAELIKRVQ